MDFYATIAENGDGHRAEMNIKGEYTMDKVRVGVLGAGRGMTMIRQLLNREDAELVAICDLYEPALKSAGETARQYQVDVALYPSFEDFLNHPGMDAVVLANYANAHAPFAIRCLEKGLHVMSEVLPVQTMQEAVELIETVEKTGKIYAYGENYCYMPAPREMRRLYRAGKIGAFEYGEGEYMHNCEPNWHHLTRADPNHWRNTMYATYYCTHSLGPLIHITGLRPVSVTAFEMPHNARMMRMGALAGHTAVEMVTLENGAIVKSLHGVGCSRNSIWYSVYGSEGRLESGREDVKNGGVSVLYTNLTDRNPNSMERCYYPRDVFSEQAEDAGHGGSDFYTTYNFIAKILGNPEAEIVDVYEAMDMFLPGLLGYRSILKGGVPVAIPNLRNPEERDAFRYDTACVDPQVAGDQRIPSYSKGNPEIPESVYETLRRKLVEAEKPGKKQLKLILFPKRKVPYGLPEGYRVCKFSGTDADKDAWVEICKNGLLPDDAARDSFDNIVANKKNIDVCEDVFFIEHNGKKVATVTAITNFEDLGIGHIHMVSVAAEERGKGLGNCLTRIAENRLYERGNPIATLTTDDWRKAACKSYLAAGFYPVNYDDDMVERWTNLITELGIESVQMLKDNGEPDRVIFAKSK